MLDKTIKQCMTEILRHIDEDGTYLVPIWRVRAEVEPVHKAFDRLVVSKTIRENGRPFGGFERWIRT